MASAIRSTSPHGTSLDTNHDDIPDECQPDVVLPPDQIVCAGPSPGSVPVGATATITVYVSRASVPLAGRWVSFHSPTGNVQFWMLRRARRHDVAHGIRWCRHG
jgi:hypothetical protein